MKIRNLVEYVEKGVLANVHKAVIDEVAVVRFGTQSLTLCAENVFQVFSGH